MRIFPERRRKASKSFRGIIDMGRYRPCCPRDGPPFAKTVAIVERLDDLARQDRIHKSVLVIRNMSEYRLFQPRALFSRKDKHFLGRPLILRHCALEITRARDDPCLVPESIKIHDKCSNRRNAYHCRSRSRSIVIRRLKFVASESRNRFLIHIDHVLHFNVALERGRLMPFGQTESLDDHRISADRVELAKCQWDRFEMVERPDTEHDVVFLFRECLYRRLQEFDARSYAEQLPDLLPFFYIFISWFDPD